MPLPLNTVLKYLLFLSVAEKNPFALAKLGLSFWTICIITWITPLFFFSTLRFSKHHTFNYTHTHTHTHTFFFFNLSSSSPAAKMPKTKAFCRSLAMKRRLEQKQDWTALPPRKDFERRRGTGQRPRVRRWPVSLLTDKQCKLVLKAQQPDKKSVLVVGDSHLRPLVDGFVLMPEGPVAYSYLSIPGATATEIRTEVLHTEVPFTPDAVCVLAPGNNLEHRLVTDSAQGFAALLATVLDRWPKVLDFPPRLTVKPEVQTALRQEYHRVAARIGLTFVYMADHLPLHQLYMWCYDGVQLSTDFGTPVLVEHLHAAVLHQLAPPSPRQGVLCHNQSSPRVPPRLVVTSPVHIPVYGPAPEWTLVGREVQPVTAVESTFDTDIPSNPVWFSEAVLDSTRAPQAIRLSRASDKGLKHRMMSGETQLMMRHREGTPRSLPSSTPPKSTPIPNNH